MNRQNKIYGMLNSLPHNIYFLEKEMVVIIPFSRNFYVLNRS